MRRWSVFVFFSLGLALLVGGFLLGKSSNQEGPKPQNSPPQGFSLSQSSPRPTDVLEVQGDTVLVTKVIDGDTIQIGEKTVRYIGIDTPETVGPRAEVACFGKEASLKNKELVEGKKVRLEKDVSETDKFGRLLRYVYVNDRFVNDFLVRQGYAFVSTFPPDVKYQEQFVEAQREARENDRGLWSACGDDVSAPTKSGEPQLRGVQTENDRDCSDFSTQKEAQSFFISQGGPASDPHRLDQDKDGIACESLP